MPTETASDRRAEAKEAIQYAYERIALRAKPPSDEAMAETYATVYGVSVQAMREIIEEVRSETA